MTQKTPKGFVRLDRELVRGETFAAISGNATRLLIAIIDGHNGRNNGSIVYGIAQAMRWLNCSNKTAIKAFTELQTAGLIQVTKKAAFNNKADAARGEATAWKLTFL